MKVYVEINFVLEVARKQEQSESCDGILGFCRANGSELIVPAYSLVEPHETMIRHRRDRKRFKDDLEKELKQLARSARFAERAKTTT